MSCDLCDPIGSVKNVCNEIVSRFFMGRINVSDQQELEDEIRSLLRRAADIMVWCISDLCGAPVRHHVGTTTSQLLLKKDGTYLLQSAGATTVFLFDDDAIVTQDTQLYFNRDLLSFIRDSVFRTVFTLEVVRRFRRKLLECFGMEDISGIWKKAVGESPHKVYIAGLSTSDRYSEVRENVYVLLSSGSSRDHEIVVRYERAHGEKVYKNDLMLPCSQLSALEDYQDKKGDPDILVDGLVYDFMTRSWVEGGYVYGSP